MINLHCGDCLEVMATLAPNSIDSIVTDPPYGLSFMGKAWDHGVPGVPFWEAALRVAKPGAMLLAFGGTRTHHRLMVAIEDAGWEIRDCLMWLYGSGFPKSHNIAVGIDKAAGAIGDRGKAFRTAGAGDRKDIQSANGKEGMAYVAPVTDAARTWDGWGTALKPAHEIIVRAIKPFPDQTERDIIVGNLCQKEAQLWLLLHVSTAGHNSTLSQAELNDVLSIAQWSAEKLTSTQAVLCGTMDTSQFASTVNMCLSIVTSWKSMLVDLWKSGNTSTISTVLSGTTELATLSYLLSATTLESIIQAEMQAPGSRLNALPVGAYLNAVAMSINATRTLSALGNATYGERTKRLDATADLSPAWEPIIMAMKPLDGTFANNALVHGVAGINVDGCRIGTDEVLHAGAPRTDKRSFGKGGTSGDGGMFDPGRGSTFEQHPQGRWPANLLLDEEAAALLDDQAGILKSGKASSSGHKRNTPPPEGIYGGGKGLWSEAGDAGTLYGDSGGASRFFYVAKASKKERGEGNNHPTLKPLALMRHLCRLTATPTGGVVLDPFMGSGTTGLAAKLEGRDFIGIDLNPEYVEIAGGRIEA